MPEPCMQNLSQGVHLVQMDLAERVGSRVAGRL